MLEKQPANSAAIASEAAAQLYRAKILKRKIEDNPNNFTRFFLLTKQPYTPKSAGGMRKTSIVFSTANTPGALFKTMACFALRDLNLTKIESRPGVRSIEVVVALGCAGRIKPDSATTAADRTLSDGSCASALSDAVSARSPAARAAYMRTCHVGCASNRGMTARAESGARRASDTAACAP